jgi:uncharacterized protein (DUF2252 family)
VGAAARTSSDEPARPEQLRRALLDHDRTALARDAAPVAGKFARMARSTFAFFRGTAWLVPREPSRFAPPAASQVAVLGDPHPENVGTYQSGSGQRVIDFNDFDLAGYGSYVDDLRRLALGLWIIADMADLKHKQRLKVVADLVEGYVMEVQGLTAGRPPLSLRAGALSGELDDVLADPDEEAAIGKQTPASAADAALARAVLARAPATLHAPARYQAPMFAIKRVTRLHTGVASFPLLRLRVLVEGPTRRADDDWWLELKESASAVPAAQLVAIQRQFQELPDDDPLLGWAEVEGRQFRMRQVSPAQRRLDAERIAKRVKSPSWKKSDLRDLSQNLGRLLARGHCRAQAKDGHPGLPAIAAAVGTGDGLRAETTAYAERHAPAVEADLRLFRKLIAERGPLLGWTPP